MLGEVHAVGALKPGRDSAGGLEAEDGVQFCPDGEERGVAVHGRPGQFAELQSAELAPDPSDYRSHMRRGDGVSGTGLSGELRTVELDEVNPVGQHHRVLFAGGLVAF